MPDEFDTSQFETATLEESKILGTLGRRRRKLYFPTAYAAYVAADVNPQTWMRFEKGEVIRRGNLAKILLLLWPASGGDFRKLGSWEHADDGRLVLLIDDAINRVVPNAPGVERSAGEYPPLEEVLDPEAYQDLLTRAFTPKPESEKTPEEKKLDAAYEAAAAAPPPMALHEYSDAELIFELSRRLQSRS